MLQRDSLPVFVGLRYANVRSGSLLLSFLSRIAMIGLVVGVALLITVLSVMNGFDRELRDRILTIVPHITYYYQPQQSSSGGNVNWEQALSLARSNPAVKEVVPFIEHQGLLRNADNSVPVLFYGIEQYHALESYLAPDELNHWQAMPDGVLVSQYLAEKLGVKRGDSVLAMLPLSSNAAENKNATDFSRLQLQIFTIAGVYDTHTELDKGFVVVHLPLLQTLLGLSAPQGFRVALYDLFRAPVIEWQLLNQLPDGFAAEDWSRTHGNLYEAVQTSRALVSMLMFIIIAVAVFNIVSILMLVVIEKRQAIAILRVQGASRTAVMKIFLVQGTLVGAVGAISGAIIGCVLSWVLPSLVTVLEHALHFQFLKTEVYPINYIPSDIRLFQVLLVVVIAVFFSFIASLYPAWQAAQAKPANVLRYE